MIIFDDRALKVLSREQQELKDLLEDFSRTHFLIGGTAIALQLGHRKSIDFDFINSSQQGNILDFKKRIEDSGFKLLRSDVEKYYGAETQIQDEFHVVVHGVRLSVFNYYRTLYDDQKICICPDIVICNGLKTLSLDQLLCTKLFACITRNKWKDAVDIYFILQNTSLTLDKAFFMSRDKYFINIFRIEPILEQFISGDWDTTESVEYLIDNPPSDEEIILYLQNQAIQILEN